eukprot:TRINITY_DN5195_c0_g2_i2.p1 TRINITY_DN5195_c0_g2~~TRINITY_DN5195_c0_g2_i2.p1  ORF type:complete len:308 (+),score=48.40 TRINITY_DN5195_c0_g2_i2:66-989(+)
MTAKLFILHENEEWIKPLIAALTEHDIPHEQWNLSDGVIDLTEDPPPGVFYSRMSASSHTRDHGNTPGFGMAILNWLERHGRIVVNGTKALQLELSKAEQHTELQKMNIRTPKTIIVLGKDRLVAAAEKYFPTGSFITKHNRGGKGLGVHLFHSVTDLAAYVEGPEFELPYDGITLLQQYIKSPDQHITRVEFINNKPLYSMRVSTASGFELCPAEACALDPNKFLISTEVKAPSDLIRSYQRLLESNDINIAGIEFIKDSEGNIYTYDINTTTNYNKSAENKAGATSGIESQVAYFKHLIEQVKAA